MSDQISKEGIGTSTQTSTPIDRRGFITGLLGAAAAGVVAGTAVKDFLQSKEPPKPIDERTRELYYQLTGPVERVLTQTQGVKAEKRRIYLGQDEELDQGLRNISVTTKFSGIGLPSLEVSSKPLTRESEVIWIDHNRQPNEYNSPIFWKTHFERPGYWTTHLGESMIPKTDQQLMMTELKKLYLEGSAERQILDAADTDGLTVNFQFANLPNNSVLAIPRFVPKKDDENPTSVSVTGGDDVKVTSPFQDNPETQGLTWWAVVKNPNSTQILKPLRPIAPSDISLKTK